MKKFISVGFATIASLFLILIIVFTTLQVVINNDTFINNEFTKLEVNKSMGISNTDLVRSMVRLVDYMEGKVDDIQLTVTVNNQEVNMFDLDQEVEHMKDVRTIYQKIRNLRDFGVLAMLILFLLGAVVDFRRAPQTISQGYLSGSFIALLFFGFLGTWAAMDFSSFWTFFHQMLFWNDLWLFDATESRMINMLPEQMFSDIVSQLFLYAGIVIALLIGLSILCLVVSSDGYKRKRTEQLQRRRAREKAKAEQERAKAEAKAAAEKAKRIAAKKAQRAEAEKRRAQAAEAEQREAEKAAAKAARAKQQAQAKKKAAASRTKASRAEEAEDRTPVAEEPVSKESSGRRPAPRPQAAKPKKKPKSGGNVADDTGFLDD